MLVGPEPFLRIHVDVAEILHLGATPYGERRIVHITGGSFTGEQLSGRIIPGGADWQLMRLDGVADIQARYTLETEQGERIFVSSEGLRHGPANVIAALGRGEPVDPATYYFRTVMRFETSATSLAWINRILAIARGARQANSVTLAVHEVL